MVTEENAQGVPDDESCVVIEESLVGATDVRPWYRRRSILAGIALVVAALIAALLFTNGRADRLNSAESAPGQTISQYIKENQITSVPVRLGDPGAPTIVVALPKDWSDLGKDTPEWAYGAVQWDGSPDPNDPPTIIVLLSKLTGDVDPAKILEYAPNELKNLPGYQLAADPNTSQLSGFDAVQLAGFYERDGKKRTIAQKTVVIPSKNAVYVLQMNADALDGDTVALVDATDAIDKRTTIKP